MFAARLQTEIEKKYIGNSQTIRPLLVALFTGGHILLEGVPGLAKTTLAKALAQAVDADFKRIQFTSDLMPADITGSNIYKLHTGEFEFIPGPIFTNILLADEINRASARTQSALLEAMQEYQVSIDGRSYPLSRPFFVIATQNPEEERGTYRLPESQLDRFMFRLQLSYPTAAQEKEIILQASRETSEIVSVLKRTDFIEIEKKLQSIRVSDAMAEYIAKLIRATRESSRLLRGASPRAGTMLLHAARGFAFLRGGEFVEPDDIQMAAPLILNHRLVLKDERENVYDIIRSLLKTIRWG